MRRLITMALVVLLFSQFARGDDEIKPEDLKKLYSDTLVQLKAAQDRKAQLATENEKLSARVADLEKQLAAQNLQIEGFKHQSSTFADRTFFLRVHYMTWMQFLEYNPLIKLQWDLYLESLTAPTTPSLQLPFIDPQWPLSSRD